MDATTHSFKEEWQKKKTCVTEDMVDSQYIYALLLKTQYVCQWWEVNVPDSLSESMCVWKNQCLDEGTLL